MTTFQDMGGVVVRDDDRAGTNNALAVHSTNTG